MVLNIDKLKEKNRLAKSMVERGLARNLDEASAKIEQQGLIHNSQNLSTDNTPLENLRKRAISQTQENDLKDLEKENVQEQREEAAKAAAIDPKVLQRIEQLEKFVQEFKAFFDRYRSVNDNNLKELVSNIKSLRADLSDAGSRPKVQQQKLQREEKDEQRAHPRQPEMKRGPQSEESDTTRAEFDTSEYSVEKVFSNANGRLMKKKS